MISPASATVTSLPDSYDDCHKHGQDLFCVDEEGRDVEVRQVGAEEGEEDHSEHGEDHSEEPSSGGENCHFHAGVEHCVGGDESESATATLNCERTDRDYNVPLRIGFLFIILVTSAIGVFGPIFLQKALPKRLDGIFTILKQFGTGVIISTAFVHLYTHASLMFDNQCLASRIRYEATPAAILMAGLFLSFLIEYLGQRFVQRKAAKEAAAAASASLALDPRTVYEKTEMINIMVLEAGIIFHSLIIGLTLVVAGDSFFKTLFIVILFHQIFEGIALGSRIAALGTKFNALLPSHGHGHGAAAAAAMTHGPTEETKATPPSSDRQSSTHEAVASEDGDRGTRVKSTVTLSKKLLLAAAFALITPVGMAIGIGVLDQFNGNDPATLISIGTLDALSAGILVWVGVVEMWAEDWMMPGGDLVESGVVMTMLAFTGLIAGMALMSLLGLLHTTLETSRTGEGEWPHSVAQDSLLWKYFRGSSKATKLHSGL